MVAVKETLMAPETGEAVIDYSLSIHDKLTVEVNGKRRPRKLHALFRDAANALVYPPLVLVAVNGDEKGLVLEFVGPLWWLGSGGIGPMIDDREYVSGFDKLDNGSFDLDDLYWRRASEGGMWVLSGGNATNAGGLGKDDVLQSERKFPTRPGHGYRMRLEGVSGTGRGRGRIIFDGDFNPADLLTNGNFEGGATGWAAATNLAIVASGARTGTYAMRVQPIPKPQLIAGSEFSSSAGWSVAATHAISGGKLIASENTKPQYIADPNFNSGPGGWVGVAPNIGDVSIVNEPSQGFGGWTMKAGPVTQHQVFLNADFGAGLANWYSSSTDADPHAVWNVDVGGGNNGTDGIRTTGWSTAARPGPETIKYLRADSVNGGGVDTYSWSTSESYDAQAYLRGHPGTDGEALISIMWPHPTVPGHDEWRHSETLKAPPHDVNQWTAVTIKGITVPPNRPVLNALVEVRNHSLGYWSVDTFTLTRTRGNRARIESTTAYPVTANTEYLFSADIRSGGAQQEGSVRLGVILKGSGMTNREVAVDKGSTDWEWNRESVAVRVPAGYTTATPFVAAQDIVGDPVWLDMFTFQKVSNNSAKSAHAPFVVTPDQRYLLSADVASLSATRGEITVGVTLTGSGVTATDVEVSMGVGDGTAKAISTEVRPPPGYTVATPYVRSTDIEGGTFTVDALRLTKMDNNSDSSAGTAIAVTPERTYRWLQAARSGTALQRGTVKLSVRCTRAGYADVTFDSSPMEPTLGAWKFIDFSFTPPSGYATVIPSIVGTDVEGDYWHLDDGEIRDTDAATVVVDTTMDNPAGATADVFASAPAGAEYVRVAVVAEQGTSGWTVGSVALNRTGHVPATGNVIVGDMLEDPETGLVMSLAPSTINCPEPIPYDWVIQNMTNRDALDHYCNVVSEPTREYRVLATDPPSIDVGTQAAVCTVHDPADALLPEDRDVETLSNPNTNVEERATEIEVIGAEVQTVTGRPFLITATAQVPGPVEYDYNNRPIVRTKQVHDGTVDHRGYAQALADDLAEREAEPALALNVKLSGNGKDPITGERIRPDSPPGDTVHAYHPESGLTDPNNPVVINGQRVFPRAARVLLRERWLGPSYSITMRRSDGTTFPLPGVRWADEDATMLTIGDRLPQWISDPQGKAGGDDFLRWRAQKPR